MAALRLSFAGALLLCVSVEQIAAATSSQTLHLTVVVVAVKCAKGTGLRAAETNGRGRFEVAVPTAAPGSGSGSRCAARILGGQEQLCTLPRFAASRVVVVAGCSRLPGSYALASRLAVFTRCASTTDAAVATTTTTDAAADETTRAMARVPVID